MKKSLTDKQKYQVCQWLEFVKQSSNDLYESIEAEAAAASIDLDFKVTHSNMESAEKATGISLVKVKEVRVNNLEARIAKLENDLASFREYCKGCALPIIKPGANKPMFCHKNG
jgi:hypothetical protein